jgi:hypothetical protein
MITHVLMYRLGSFKFIVSGEIYFSETINLIDLFFILNIILC